MATIKNFEDLEIWKKAIKLSDELYELCQIDFLKKDYSTQDQLKRAALSISNNIAEGFEYTTILISLSSCAIQKVLVANVEA